MPALMLHIGYTCSLQILKFAQFAQFLNQYRLFYSISAVHCNKGLCIYYKTHPMISSICQFYKNLI